MAKKKSDGETKPARVAPVKNSESTKDTAKTAPAVKATPPAAPVIDTSLAANAAAALVAGKVALPASKSPAKKESAAFKHLKAGLNKPAALGGAFGVIGQSKKSQQGHGGGKQAGHSQTFGADVNRTGVPRRTPG